MYECRFFWSNAAFEAIFGWVGFGERMKAIAPEGVIILSRWRLEPMLMPMWMLKMGGSIGAYSTYNATPRIPFWFMVFKNIRLYFLGSDDFPAEAKVAATRDLNDALQAGWSGFELADSLGRDRPGARTGGRSGSAGACCCYRLSETLEKRTDEQRRWKTCGARPMDDGV